MEQFVLLVLSTVAMSDLAATVFALSAVEVPSGNRSQVGVLSRQLMRQY